MRLLRSRIALALTALALNALAWGAAAYAAVPVIQEFQIPRSESTPLPTSITAGPDGNLWFLSPPNRIGVVSTAGVLVKMVTVSASLDGIQLNSIVTGPDGNLWFCENYTGKIGRLTPGGAYTEFAIPTPDSLPSSITVGSDGALWFVEAGAKKIGRITTAGAIQEFTLSTPHIPYSITAGPDGNLWIANFVGGIIRFTLGGATTEFPVTFPGPQQVTVGPDGNIWFTGPGKVGRVTPAGVVTEFAVPNLLSGADIEKGPDGNLWFTEFDAHRIASISTSGQLAEHPIPVPSPFPANVALPNGITLGPDGNLWFTELAVPGIGRITQAGGPCVPNATTLCIDDQPNDRRWQLTVTYSTQGGSLSGSGQAVALNSLGVEQGGLFWFFDPTNPEMLVKVINACSFNQHFWVFSAATTNVGLNLVLRDTRTGTSKSYSNADGHTATPIQDVTAFACTGGDLAAEPPPAPDPLLSSAGTELTYAQDPALDGKAACVPSATNLCLGGGRFSIQVAYHTRQGGGLSGSGQTLPLQSLGVTKGGLFWFFGATNPEMLVKVIDACSFNHQFWISYAATTNVGFTVTVTDQQTGHKHQYTNSDGTAAAPVLDTSALPCP
jgi:streptogramin lyase